VEKVNAEKIDLTLAVFTPAAESHGLWPWMNAPALGRDVAPLGRSLGATGFARGAPQKMGCVPVFEDWCFGRWDF